MMFRSLALFTVLLPTSSGFSTVFPVSRLGRQSEFLTPSAMTVLKMSDFGSDFQSAMPAKPELTVDEKIAQSADDTIEIISNALGPGVEAPPELKALKDARKSGAGTSELTLRVYELMIERGMLYDEEPETGALTPTEFNIKENLDVQEVKDEFGHLYKYGMTLMDRGLLTADEVKTTVLERLIKRTGLSPEEFDKWLGY